MQQNHLAHNLLRATPENVIREFPELGLNENRWRWLMRQRRQNGLSKAIVAVGGPRRLYLDLEKFRDWLESQREQAA